MIPRPFCARASTGYSAGDRSRIREVNRKLKHAAERAMVASGISQLSRLRLRSRRLVLAYHNILPASAPRAGNLNLHLPQQEFARQLDVLAATHEDELWSARSGSRPRVAITFDDAYEGALTVGVVELVRRNMQATIFVAPALFAAVAWWDVLADKTDGVVPDRVQRHALENLRGRSDDILSWAQSSPRGGKPRSDLPSIGSEQQVLNAAMQPGISLGSHTWSHPNLAVATPRELDEELSRPLTWLRQHTSIESTWLTYPYGRFNFSVERAAASAGYKGSFRIDGGWMHRSDTVSHAIPRLNIPAGLSLDGFRLRLSGLL
jgi:peptidoglycan/xylan/chitin deacetylase (PgdA/CDA1 family)